MKIKINRNAILAMELLSGRDDSRYVICRTVNFEITGNRCILVATDGRKLGAMLAGEVLVPSDKPESITVNFDMRMLKAIPKAKNGITALAIEFEGRRVIVSPHGNTSGKPSIEFEAIEGDFPKWRHALPTGELQSPINPILNWRLLEPFVKIAELNGSSENGIRVRQGSNPLEAMLVLLPGLRDTFVGAIMPMRSVYAESAPIWAAIETKPEPAPEPATATLPTTTTDQPTTPTP